MKFLQTLAIALTLFVFTGNFNALKAQVNPGDLVITEIMYNNPGIDTLEFFEVYNATANSIDLTGFIIGYAWNTYVGPGPASSARDTLPTLTIPAGGRVVFADNAAAFQSVFGQAPDYEYQNFFFGNGGGRVYITDPNGVIIDSVHYDDVLPWPPAADGLGPSLTLCDETANNDDPANWTTATTLVSGTTNIYAHPWQDCPPGPVVTNVDVVAANKIIVYFDTQVDATAENTANYSLASGIAIASAVRTASLQQVVLTLATNLTVGNTDTLTVQNVQDLANSAPMLQPQDFPVTYNGTDGPMVTNVSFLSSTSILVTFNMMVNNTAENTANYSLASGIAITSATRNASFDAVTLTLASALSGTDTLTVQNVQDSFSATPMNPPYSYPFYFNTTAPGDLVITEIMFKGKSGTGDTLEYFEFYNATQNPIQLNGITTEGVTYTFPDTVMPAGAYWLLAKSKSAIMTVFNPNTTVLQWTTGGLQNSGEAIVLRNSLGQAIDTVRYNTTGWISFLNPGQAFVLCDINSDNNNGANWDTTTNAITFGGTTFYASPGEANTCTTVNLTSLNSSLNIYPNPATTTIFLNSPVKIQAVNLYNLQGQMLISSDENQIDVEHLARGIYILKVQTQDGTVHTRKIIKQ